MAGKKRASWQLFSCCQKNSNVLFNWILVPYDKIKVLATMTEVARVKGCSHIFSTKCVVIISKKKATIINWPKPSKFSKATKNDEKEEPSSNFVGINYMTLEM